MEISTKELKALEEAFEKKFTEMGDGVKRMQDAADNAVEEVRREGGTMHAETNVKLTELSEVNAKTAEEFKSIRDEMLEIHQKYALKPTGSSDAQKSFSEIVLESEQWLAASKRANAVSMDEVMVGSFHKTLILNATGQNQPLVPAQRVPGIITPPEERMYVRDLIPAATTTSNLIEYTTEATYTSNAGPQYDASPGSTEGARKAESAMTFQQSNAAMVTLAHWIPATRQVLSDATMLQGHLNTRLLYGLKLEEETEFLTGDGTAGTINGLVTQATAFNGGGTNQTILDTLLRALLQVSLSNYEASAFVMHPTDWYSAMLLKDSQGRYLFSDPQSMVAPRMWAKPVVASQRIATGNFLCGAFNLAAQIWDRENATIRISENVEDFFVRNMVVILAEERTTLVVYRPTALVYGATETPG